MPSRPRSDSSAAPTPDPSESPSPSPAPIPTSPLFSAPRSPDTSTPDPTEPPSWTEADEPAAADQPAPESPSAPRLSGRARLKALRGTIGQAVLTVGGIANQLLTRPNSPQREEGLWFPDEDDVEAIATPLASLASRRAPEGIANPDTVDLVALAAGVVGYFMKQRAHAADIADRYRPEVPDLTDLEEGAPA